MASDIGTVEVEPAKFMFKPEKQRLNVESLFVTSTNAKRLEETQTLRENLP